VTRDLRQQTKRVAITSAGSFLFLLVDDVEFDVVVFVAVLAVGLTDCTVFSPAARFAFTRSLSDDDALLGTAPRSSNDFCFLSEISVNSLVLFEPDE
jgi:hypothetical protein